MEMCAMCMGIRIEIFFIYVKNDNTGLTGDV